MYFKMFKVLMVSVLVICYVNLSTSKTIARDIDPETGHVRGCPNATVTTPECGCTDPPPTPVPTKPDCGCDSPTTSSCPSSETTEEPAPPCTDPPAVIIPQPYPGCPTGVADPHHDTLLSLPKCCQFVHCDNFGVGHVKNCAPSDPPLVFSPCQNRCVWPWEAGNITCDLCTC